jgi:hypothetical protein
MRSRSLIVLALVCAAAQPASAGPIEDLRPGEWYMVPNSNLETVFPNPAPEGNTGPSSVIAKWSGGAYDTKRDRLIVWGGGHWDYSGNEMYVFRINSENGDPPLTWKRLTNPTMDVSGSGSYYSDGKPRSRHTLDYVEYIPPPFDRFCSFGGTSLYPGTVTENTDCFNFDTLQWSRYADNTQSYGEGATVVYDPVKGHIWAHGASPSPTRLSEYNPSTNTWTVRGEYQSSLEYVYEKIGVIDPVRRKYVIIGNGVLVSFNIDDAGTLPMTNLAPLTTGATSIQNSTQLGAAYDPVSDRIVAWSGGTDVYLLNMSTLVWTRVPPAATNTVTPTSPASAGTYGRFRYIPSKNAFIVVNATNQNVYFYKLSAGGGTPPDSIPPNATTDLRPR